MDFIRKCIIRLNNIEEINSKYINYNIKHFFQIKVNLIVVPDISCSNFKQKYIYYKRKYILNKN